MFMRHARITIVTVLALVLAAWAAPVPTARAAANDRKAQLQERFKDRYADLQKLLSAGKVGETPAGTVEAVGGGLDQAARKTVDAENADRAELYQILAKEIGTTAEKVAHINGARRIKELRSGQYYKDDEGRWQKKG
jgi:uncharacterized protein YdbL (DUF1318 family)